MDDGGLGMTKYVRARWVDGAFRPAGAWEQDRCERDYAGAGTVVLTVEHERDMVSHRKHFAIVRTAWLNLPESLRDMDFAASDEVLRKYALVRTGHCDVTTAVAFSHKVAITLGAQMGDLARRAHGYALVEVEKRVVRVWTPHSQAVRAMGSATFEQSDGT